MIPKKSGPSFSLDDPKNVKTAKTPSKQTATSTLSQPVKSQAATATAPSEIRKGPKTKIVVKYDVGFSNVLYLRGKGANLSWERGTPLKNIKVDEWVWETEIPFTTCEFKVLINDKQYETGENHPLTCGSTVQYTPRF